MRTMQRTTRIQAAALFLAATSLVCQRAPSSAAESPEFGDAFWKFWGDGRAELAAYDITLSRYGAIRRGTAVAVFVTETFSRSLRVKADPGKHPADDEFPVIKLNLVQDFPTGIYDYNMMTSAFVALVPVNGRPAGAATKVSFSAQEWCGHAYSQALFDETRIRLQSHSYFDGEADLDTELPGDSGLLSEDVLLLWARGLAGPVLGPGETVTTDVLKSLRVARLTHTPVDRGSVRLARAAGVTSVTVPAGTFAVEERTATLASGRTWTFQVEAAEPHRLIRWSCSDGETAELLASERLPYWKMHDPGFESELSKLGLSPRGPRMP